MPAIVLQTYLSLVLLSSAIMVLPTRRYMTGLEADTPLFVSVGAMLLP